MVVNIPNANTYVRLATHSAVLRAIHFLRTVRDNLLINGAALGATGITFRVEYTTRGNTVFESDDSWDATTRSHTSHLDDDDDDIDNPF